MEISKGRATRGNSVLHLRTVFPTVGNSGKRGTPEVPGGPRLRPLVDPGSAVSRPRTSDWTTGEPGLNPGWFQGRPVPAADSRPRTLTISRPLGSPRAVLPAPAAGPTPQQRHLPRSAQVRLDPGQPRRPPGLRRAAPPTCPAPPLIGQFARTRLPHS